METNDDNQMQDQGQAPVPIQIWNFLALDEYFLIVNCFIIAQEEELNRPEDHINPDELKDKSRKEDIMGLKTGTRGDTAIKEDPSQQQSDDEQKQQSV